MDANAINRTNQKTRARAGASRAASSGGGVLSRHVCSAQMTAGSAAIVRLPHPPAGHLLALSARFAEQITIDLYLSVLISV